MADDTKKNPASAIVSDMARNAKMFDANNDKKIDSLEASYLLAGQLNAYGGIGKVMEGCVLDDKTASTAQLYFGKNVFAPLREKLKEQNLKLDTPNGLEICTAVADVILDDAAHARPLPEKAPVAKPKGKQI